VTKEEYLALPHEDKKLALSSYLDGFQAAIDVVKSIKIRVGHETVDSLHESAINSVVHILESNLSKLTPEGK
jgi:hypothetical protein